MNALVVAHLLRHRLNAVLVAMPQVVTADSTKQHKRTYARLGSRLLGALRAGTEQHACDPVRSGQRSKPAVVVRGPRELPTSPI